MRKSGFMAVIVGMGLSVNAFAAGTGTLDKVSGWYPAGSNLTVKASPLSHNVFSSWSGDTNGCSISGTQIVISVSQPRSITAIFSSEQHTLQVVSARGAPVPSVGTHSYNYNTPLTNSVASPVPSGSTTQYVCTGWAMTGNSPAAGASNSFTMSLTNNAVLTWNWNTQHWLDITAGANGTVDKTDQWVDSTGSVTINATPNTGYHFGAWSGNTAGCTISGAQITAPMTGARQITASFAINTYTVTFVEGANGTRTSGGALVQTINHGAAATAPVITANAGWTFAGWNALFDNVTSNMTVTAQYVQNTYSLQVNSAHGSAVPAVGSYSNYYGTVVNCSVTNATINSGTTQYVCKGWVMTGNAPLSGTGTNFSMTVTNNAVLTWQWQTNYWVELTVTGN